MSKFFSVLAVVAALASPALANADPLNNDLAMSLGVGTEGIGGELAVPLVRHTLNLNVGYSGFSHDFNFHADDANFDSHLRLGAVPLVLAWYPFHNNFSIDGGAYINLNQVTAHGTPDAGGSYTINGNKYTADQVGAISGKTHFNTVAPYVGIGYGDPFEGGRWTFLANVGAMYEGGSNIHLASTGAASNPQLAHDVAVVQHQANNRLNFLNWWPVVTIALAYRF